MTQRIMVKLNGNPDAYPLTYEVEGVAEVGDFVEAPYGRDNRRYPGKVVALGAQPREYVDGTSDPPYDGPCKLAQIRLVRDTRILNLLPAWMRLAPLPSYFADDPPVCAGCGEEYHLQCPSLGSGIPPVMRHSEWAAVRVGR
jgi:hypothetical protein